MMAMVIVVVEVVGAARVAVRVGVGTIVEIEAEATVVEMANLRHAGPHSRGKTRPHLQLQQIFYCAESRSLYVSLHVRLARER